MKVSIVIGSAPPLDAPYKHSAKLGVGPLPLFDLASLTWVAGSWRSIILSDAQLSVALDMTQKEMGIGLMPDPVL